MNGTGRPERVLKAELDAVVRRLRTGTEVPTVGSASGDFLDVAQGLEHQELARLVSSRLTDRARRLRVALQRVSEEGYGRCSECGEPIPPKRLVAVPDATTCVPCQARLESIAG